MGDFLLPVVLQCNHFKAQSHGKDSRHVKDYEFDFYISGEREMYIDGRHHQISRGALVFRKPGQLVESYGDYDMYALTLDFSRCVDIPQDKYLRNRRPPVQDVCHQDIFNDVPETFFPAHQEEIIMLMKKIINCSYPNIIDIDLQNKLVAEFLFLVLSDAYKYNREYEYKSPKDNYIDKACKYINKNYSNDITIEDIASHLSLNKHYLIRLFKKALSTTPNQYILDTRLFYARLMLIQSDLSVKNVGLSCGFNTTSYFIKCFKNKFGKSPGLYKKLAQTQSL